VSPETGHGAVQFRRQRSRVPSGTLVTVPRLLVGDDENPMIRALPAEMITDAQVIMRRSFNLALAANSRSPWDYVRGSGHKGGATGGARSY
jgi:hypothetical protein